MADSTAFELPSPELLVAPYAISVPDTAQRHVAAYATSAPRTLTIHHVSTEKSGGGCVPVPALLGCYGAVTVETTAAVSIAL
eukprot:1013228-Rhodomonas_salina.2